jgi:hydroxymethylbilane synthase
VIAAVAPLDDADTRACVAAERALLAALEAGCTAPVGALAEVVDSGDGVVELSLRAFAGSLDAAVDLRRSIVGPVEQAEQLGRELAAVLLADGASEISTSIAQPAPAGRPPDPGGAGGDDLPLAVPAAHLPSASHPDRPTPERAS